MGETTSANVEQILKSWMTLMFVSSVLEIVVQKLKRPTFILVDVTGATRKLFFRGTGLAT